MEAKPCNKDNMHKLVDALRSGDYKQAKSALRDVVDGDLDNPVYGYCCLGVATHLAQCAGVDIDQEHTNPVTGAVTKSSTWDVHSFLAPAVKEWLGVEENNPLLNFDDGNVIRAAFANDNGMTFDNIAEGFSRTYLYGSF